MDNVHRSTASLIVPQVGSTAPKGRGGTTAASRDTRVALPLQIQTAIVKL